MTDEQFERLSTQLYNLYLELHRVQNILAEIALKIEVPFETVQEIELEQFQ